jgi:galactokinase
MAIDRKAPNEILQLEWLLKKPNSDPTGLASFFTTGEIIVTRVPARLDVMGGISDYSGANVCEGVLGGGVVIALQPRTDRTLRIRTMQANRVSLAVETRIPLDYFEMGEGEGFVSYEQIQALCKSNPLSSWAAYIGGSIFTLLKEQSIHLPFGFNLFLLSGVPMNVGIGSSATVEIATLYCLQSYLGLDISETNLAKLGQLAENLVVGAPCGIMDQITVTSGRQGKLTHILCRPGSIMREVEIPPDTAFVGINSMIKHSVGGAAYSDVRIGAFMGKRIINHVRAQSGENPIQYLTELTADSFENNYRAFLPETILGSEFLANNQSHDDPITRIQPDATYRVAGPTAHPVWENSRVIEFMDHLISAADGNQRDLVAAGECMVASHASYRDNCLLSVPEVDFIVDAVCSRGPQKGLYGAKITGGGSGGAIAVFGQKDALEHEIPAITREYKRLTGLEAELFEGSSPGATEFGVYRYTFGPMGWTRSIW